MSGVFLSYRRNDVGLIAADIAEGLRARLDVPLFFDLESIQPGSDFKEKIVAAINECDAAVVLLGNNWEGREADGRVRIREPDDIFRHEIEAALSARVYIVPVLVGTQEISGKVLGNLAALKERQWHQIRLGYKKTDIHQLAEVVAEAVSDRHKEKLAGDSGRAIAFEPYTKFFRAEGGIAPRPPDGLYQPGNDPVFRADADFQFRVNLALATRLPLLLISSDPFRRLAAAKHIAHTLGARYYEHTLSSRSKISDLLYSYDEVRRLRDAQMRERLASECEYVTPGPLWWAFDETSARRRGMPSDGQFTAATDMGVRASDLLSRSAVICVDAVENADPNYLNDLFSVLESWAFSVPELGILIRAIDAPVPVLGTVGLRAIPSAVLRSVVVYEMPTPKMDEMVQLAYTQFVPEHHGVISKIAEHLERDVVT